jgi:serine/threonine protein kinase
MEGKSLHSFMQELPEKKLKDESRLKRITTQILSSLKYLHSHGVAHQDLKPANILFTRDQQSVKLCDFGVSNTLDQTRKTNAANQGTIRYMPFE